MEQYVAVLKLDPVTWLALLWLIREVHTMRAGISVLDERARKVEDRALVLEKDVSGIRKAV